MTTKPKAMLVDITRCIGCRSCELACKALHNLPGEPEPELSATALTVVQQRGERSVRRQCMHCLEPACVSACPVGALQKTEQGPVVYERERCIGCRYCMLACPFMVPRYEWTRLVPYVKKCDLCAERVARGESPACVEVCPAGAVEFGDREAMLAEANRRLASNPGYVQHIYGEHELGGTSVLFLSDVPFEKLGFFLPDDDQPMPTLTAGALRDVPAVVTMGGAVLASLYWITRRRQEVALAEAEEAGQAQSPARLLPAGQSERS